MCDIVIPDFLKDRLEWLSLDYIENNQDKVFYPVCREWMAEPRLFPKWQFTSLGYINWISPDDLKPGDVIIFDVYESADDRFYIITEEDILEYKYGERYLIPGDIIVRPPEFL